jgi:hypothetical protein
MAHIMANGGNVQSKKACVVEIEGETAFLSPFVWSPCTVGTIQQYRHRRYDARRTQECLRGLQYIHSMLKVVITVVSAV